MSDSETKELEIYKLGKGKYLEDQIEESIEEYSNPTLGVLISKLSYDTLTELFETTDLQDKLEESVYELLEDVPSESTTEEIMKELNKEINKDAYLDDIEQMLEDFEPDPNKPITNEKINAYDIAKQATYVDNFVNAEISDYPQLQNNYTIETVEDVIERLFCPISYHFTTEDGYEFFICVPNKGPIHHAAIGFLWNNENKAKLGISLQRHKKKRLAMENLLSETPPFEPVSIKVEFLKTFTGRTTESIKKSIKKGNTPDLD